MNVGLKAVGITLLFLSLPLYSIKRVSKYRVTSFFKHGRPLLNSRRLYTNSSTKCFVKFPYRAYFKAIGYIGGATAISAYLTTKKSPENNNSEFNNNFTYSPEYTTQLENVLINKKFLEKNDNYLPPIIKLIEEGANPNAHIKERVDFTTPLQIMISKADKHPTELSKVKILLEHGANPNECYLYGYALHKVFKRSSISERLGKYRYYPQPVLSFIKKNKDLALLLLEYGANPCAGELTTLHFITLLNSYYSYELLQLYLEQYPFINVNVQAKITQETPLMTLMRSFGFSETPEPFLKKLDLLLTHGADVMAKNNKGQRAIDILRKKEKERIEIINEKISIAEEARNCGRISANASAESLNWFFGLGDDPRENYFKIAEEKLRLRMQAQDTKDLLL